MSFTPSKTIPGMSVNEGLRKIPITAGSAHRKLRRPRPVHPHAGGLDLELWLLLQKVGNAAFYPTHTLKCVMHKTISCSIVRKQQKIGNLNIHQSGTC